MHTGTRALREPRPEAALSLSEENPVKDWPGLLLVPCAHTWREEDSGRAVLSGH